MTAETLPAADSVAGDGESVCSVSINGASHLPIAGAMASEAAVLLGISSDDAARLRVITQELAAAVVESAFEPGDDVAIEVSIQRKPGGVCVVVSDIGAPSHLGKAGSPPPRLGELLQLGFADELTFRSAVRQGNEAELFKYLQYRDLREDTDLDEVVDLAEVPSEEDTEPKIVVRPLEVADTLEVARLFHRCYGYSAYQVAIVYEPDKLAEYITAGRHRGTVALVNGRLVGHIASTVDSPTSITALTGMLVVDPAYRRFKLAGQLTFAQGMNLIENGFIGIYSSCVTAHVASQKIALKFEGHEVALLVAEQQPSLEFRDIENGEQSEYRRANIWFWNGIGKEQHRELHIPRAYHEITRALYDNAKLPRTIADVTLRVPSEVAEASVLDLLLKHEAGIANIKVVSYGHDFVAAVQNQLNKLCLNRFDVIRLQMPAGDPLSSYYGSGLQELGFFYCGMNPEIHNGDVLVLQYLNNVDVDPDEIKVASEFGEELRDFVLADRAAASANADNRRRSRAHMARIYDVLQ